MCIYIYHITLCYKGFVVQIERFPAILSVYFSYPICSRFRSGRQKPLWVNNLLLFRKAYRREIQSVDSLTNSLHQSSFSISEFYLFIPYPTVLPLISVYIIVYTASVYNYESSNPRLLSCLFANRRRHSILVRLKYNLMLAEVLDAITHSGNNACKQYHVATCMI